MDALCQQPKVLRNSHIVPEFLYTPLCDRHHRLVRVSAATSIKRDLPQKGLRQPLLCNDCEQFLNDNYEKPFKHYWMDQHPLPVRLPPEGVLLNGIDYRMFKLFHLSVLFRAGVSTRPMFEDVDLGPHRAALRQMVRSKNPGRPENYLSLQLQLSITIGFPFCGL